VTLEALRRRFWWLGATPTRSFIVGLENDRATVDITQHTWSRRTQHYERSVERQLAALGLSVVWRPRWSEALRRRLDEARAAAGETFDEVAFVARMRDEEARRAKRESEDPPEGEARREGEGSREGEAAREGEGLREGEGEPKDEGEREA
jgi:hypothetical protein